MTAEELIPNTAENETWGECVDEMVICNEEGVVGAGTDRAYRPCTGGTHIGPGQFIRCTSTFHRQEGPMSPGIAFLPGLQAAWGELGLMTDHTPLTDEKLAATPGECLTLGGHDGNPCSRCGRKERSRPPAIPKKTLERERDRHRWDKR